MGNELLRSWAVPSGVTNIAVSAETGPRLLELAHPSASERPWIH